MRRLLLSSPPALLTSPCSSPLGLHRPAARTRRLRQCSLFLRSATTLSPAETHKASATAFIESHGYSPAIATGVVNALLKPGTGIQPPTLMKTCEMLIGRPEVDEDGGMAAMAKAVEQDLLRTQGRAMVKVTVSPPGRGSRPFDVRCFEGWTLKEVVEFGDDSGARLLSEYIECACDGLMACSTCQVIVDPEWFDAVGAPSEAEMDMLDLAHDPQPTSRLGCQIKVTAELEGLTLTIPDGANNLFDHIPFED